MLQKQYTHLSGDERASIAYWYNKKGYSVRHVAMLLQRDPSTVSREMSRNRNIHGNYVCADAQRMAKIRKATMRPHRCMMDDPAVAWYVGTHLKRGWSPEIIANRMQMDMGRSISHETIYQWWYQKPNRGWCHYLIRRHTRSTSRYRSNTGARTGKSTDIPSILDRPAHINARKECGHWE